MHTNDLQHTRCTPANSVFSNRLKNLEDFQSLTMKEVRLDFATHIEFIISLSILTKMKVSMPNCDSIHDSPFMAIIKTLSPETCLSVEKDSIKITPGPYCSGRHTITLQGICNEYGRFALLEPCLILGLFGKDKTCLRIGGVTNYGEPLDSLPKIHSAVLRMFMGSEPTIAISRRGFPPSGNGAFTLSIPTVKELQPISLKNEESLEWIDALVVTSRISSDFLQRAATAIKNKLEPIAKVKITSLVHNRKDSGPSPGAECTAVAAGRMAIFYAISGGVETPENISDKVCSDLLSALSSGGNVDPKLLPFTFILMGLAKGVSHLRCCKLDTSHWQALELLKLFLEVEYKVLDNGDDVIVSIIGTGYLNPFAYAS